MNSQKFNGNRLKDARIFRGKSISSLSEECQITKQTLSQYENGSIKPEPNKLFTLSCALNFPIDYFYTEDTYSIEVGTTYFRSLLSTSKIDRSAQSKRLEFLAKIFDVLCEHIDFPILNIPSIKFSGTQDENQRLQEIESIATQLREYWNLGDGPIKELKYTLESNGIIVTCLDPEAKAIDAFSQMVKINNEQIFFVAISPTQNLVRARFDMAHELAHIILHSWSEDIDALTREEFKEREAQANMLASAFLLPAESFRKDVMLYPNKLSYYVHLKKKWNVSIQAMIMRAHSLHCINTYQYQYLWRQISQKGWRTMEPEDQPYDMKSSLMQSALDLIFEEKVLTPKDFLVALKLKGIVMNASDVEKLMGLKSGTLDFKDDNSHVIKLSFKK